MESIEEVMKEPLEKAKESIDEWFKENPNHADREPLVPKDEPTDKIIEDFNTLVDWKFGELVQEKKDKIKGDFKQLIYDYVALKRK